MAWHQPKDIGSRPVAILGGGVLGRRIACTWAFASYNVHVRDPSSEQRLECMQYVDQNLAVYMRKTSSTTVGKVQVFQELRQPLLLDVWLIIEAIPEKLQLKIDSFARLEQLAPQDCILATNSSSFKSSEMLDKVSQETKRRILSMQYYMPPKTMVVELMTDGFTDDDIFPILVARLKETGAFPYVARKESTGLIFNRLWAAVEQEVLTILSEGVSVPEEIDDIWQEIFLKGKIHPCRTMDEVGLDTVAFIEKHYIAERGLSSKHTVDYLKVNYIDQGKLGNKCTAGGLYVVGKPGPVVKSPTLLVFDLGLAAPEPSATTGQVLQLHLNGSEPKPLVTGQAMLNGIDVDRSIGRMFWTAMGVPGAPDGAVYSAKTDGTDTAVVVAPGVVNTPKQLCLDTQHQQVYFCDREGCAVYRCAYDGSELQAIVKRDQADCDVMSWRVGIAVFPSRGKFYWTQKGPSKGGKGRIFCADISGPVGNSRSDITCILDNLPEPIDLHIDEKNDKLYWTDRGEIPHDNSLNSISLNAAGLAVKDSTLGPRPQILCRRFKEAIGLALDSENGGVFVTDLGGFVYCYDIASGQKHVVYENEHRAFTGIVLV
ncbi:related to 3-hydroxyacyl-CoA dehydrogenase [Fusarium torulosum]|uniref:Related to 3-hydroxyacyl-CoA dehydrogenase n=1 Tax=Fusarium torulosum TaxID=33205 RepID=A0AAE8MM83_9HYPO|nr:related to 3-hydroxyacyl-CoA dehydrogenase [Fusarium torulosum]